MAIAAKKPKPTSDLVGEKPSDQEHALFTAARRAARQADPMHSHFFVGAALLSANGHEYTGANFENDSYGMTICAERAAIARAVDAEGQGLKIVAIAVYAEDRRIPRGRRQLAAGAPGKPARTPSPCGACRQVIYQYGPGRGENTRVVFPVNGDPRGFRMVDLLPVPFQL